MAELEINESELLNLSNAYFANKSDIQTKFDYGFALIRSKVAANYTLSLQLFQEVYAEAPSRRRECLYFLAMANYKLNNHAKAKEFITTLLSKEPNNQQALALRGMIDEKVRTEGLIGLGIISVGIGLGAMILSRVFK